MKKILILISLSLFYFSSAFAVTLIDALNQTYKNNIQLNAERENIKVSKEDIKISEADLTASSQQAEESGLKDFPFDNLEDLYIQEDYTTNFDYYV